MTKAELLIEDLRGLLHAYDNPEPPPPDPPAPPPPVVSPTGAEPTLLWSSDWQRDMLRMQAEWTANSGSVLAQWFGLIREKALSGAAYGDFGLPAAILWQTTGETVYLEKLFDKLDDMFASDLNDDNNARELNAVRVLMTQWAWPGLNQERQQQMLHTLDRLMLNTFDRAIRSIDSDQVVGVYFGALFYKLAFGAIHPPAAALFDNDSEFGGLVPTGRNRDTLRNMIHDFVLMAEGGEWIESGHYNNGTVRLLMLGVNGVRTAMAKAGDATDYFPEVTVWETQAAKRGMHILTPDLKRPKQWGDEQEADRMHPQPFVTTSMMFDDPDARSHVFDLAAKHGAVGSGAAEPIPTGFLLFKPYGPRRTQFPPKAFVANGQGLVLVRSGWGENDSLFGGHYPQTYPNGPVDHNCGYFGDVELWRKGAWALRHPHTYAGQSLTGLGNNAMLHYGFGSPKEFKALFAVQPFDGGVMMVGTCGGTILPRDYYQPPPTWFHEWTRYVVCLLGADVDTIVVFDRSHISDPNLLPGALTRYKVAEKNKILGNPMREWRWHMPVRPDISGNEARWAIANGEQARIVILRDDVTITPVDQNVEWGAGTTANIRGYEKKWMVKAVLPNLAGFTTCTTVLQFGAPAAFGAIVPIGAANMEGVSVIGRRIVFNNLPGPTLPSATTDTYNPLVPGMLAGITRGWNLS